VKVIIFVKRLLLGCSVVAKRYGRVFDWLFLEFLVEVSIFL